MLEKVKSVEEGVKKLLTIRELPVPEFTIEKRKDGEYTDHLVLDGVRIPLAYWRYEPRMDRLHAYGAAPKDNACLNTYSFMGKDVSIAELIYREIDIAEYILNSRVVKVTAFQNGRACNLIAVTEAGTVANLELGATMAQGAKNQFQHRLITRRGMANDRTVNNVVEQHGVYFFDSESTSPHVYDDGEYYLFGLTDEESNEATYINGIFTGRMNIDSLIECDKHVQTVVAAVFESAKSGESVYIGGEV